MAVLVLPAAAADEQEQAVRDRLAGYIATFNSGDAERLAGFWAEDAVSVNEQTGDQVNGRAALLADFQAFFESEPGARLTGQVDSVRLVRPDVAVIRGVATVFTPGATPTPSAFTALLTRDGDEWLINSSQERDLPAPPTSADALADLDWLIGDWRDAGSEADVRTTFRWAANRAFLIRSSSVAYADGGEFEGTQVIGWDPAAKQHRTWSFNSDGSFGEGSVVRSGDEWLIRMSHTAADGTRSSATQVVTRVDDDTLLFERFGESIDGQPIPASGPVTVVRVTSSDEEEG